MQMSDKKENGIKLSWQHLSGISGIPLKKRPLSFLRSQSPPSSSQSIHAKKFNEIKIEPPSSPTTDYKTASDLSHQKSSTQNVDAIAVALFEGKDEPIVDIETSIKSSCVSDSHNQVSVPTTNSSFALELNGCMKPVLDDTIASETTRNIEPKPKISENLEYSFLESTIEKIPSDKSAFHRVFGKSEALSLKESVSLNTESDYNDPVMQEKVNPSYGDMTLDIGDLDVQSNMVEPASNGNHAQIFAKRSNWDLNTMMDTWGGFLTNEGKNHSEGGNHAAYMGATDVINKVNHETCSSGMVDDNDKTAYLLPKYSKNDKLSHSPMRPTVHLNSDAHIDLHLSPVSETPSKFTPVNLHVPKTNANGCLSDLSLTMKPSSTILNPVKSESHEINDSNVENSNSKLISCTIVKSESSTSIHEPSLLVPSKISSTPTLSVKSESQEMDYQMRMETMKESLQHKENPASYMNKYIPGTDIKENIRQIDDGMVSKSTVANHNISCNMQLKMHNTDNSNDTKELIATVWTGSTDKDREKNNHQAVRTAFYNDKSSKTTVTLGSDEANIATSVLNSESMVHCSENSVSSTHLLVTNETNGIGHGSLDVKTDTHFESKQKQENNDEHYNSCDADGEMNVMATSETNWSMDRLTDVSSKSPKLRPQNNDELGHSADGRTYTNLIGTLHDDDMEDGEVRDPQHCSSNDTSDEIQTKHIHVKEETRDKEDVHFLKCSNNQCTEDIGLHPTEDNKSFIPTVETTNENPTNMNTDLPNHHLSGTISRKASSENIITPFEEQQSEAIVDNKESSDSRLPKMLSVASNSETLANTGDAEIGFRRGDDPYLNSLPRDISPERQSGSRTALPSNIDKDSSGFSRRNGFRRGNDPYLNSFPKSFSPRRQYGYRSTLSSLNDKDSSGWSRRNDKYRGIRGGHYRDLRLCDKDRIRDGSSKKSGYDISFSPERVRFRNLNDNRISGPDFLSEQLSSSGNLRYTRPRIAPETSFAAYVDGSTDSAGGEAGTSGNDKLENFSPRPSRRWSPRQRGPILVGKQFVNRTMRGISPGRFIDSEIPVLFTPSNEGKFMRHLANNMDDPSMLTGHSNYSRGGNSSYMRRGRRDISPGQGRDSPNISIRPRLRSPHLWSPQRLPDGFDVHPELIPCRSPQSLRFQRVGSPIDGSFAENMAGRRHGSPPFVSRGRDGMRMREYEYTRHDRGIQRNVRRFQLIDPRVTVEEECFDDVAQAGQLNGMSRDDRMDNRRNFKSGHTGFVRYINRRYNDDDGISDDDSRNFSYRMERGPSRPIRFRPDAGEEQPHRQQTLRGEHCVRNRMEDSPRRIRGLDGQEGSYDVDETQGVSSSALKRRRF